MRPLPATARSLFCSWCWSSWPHTSPDPGLSSGTPPWRLLCGAGGKFNRLQNTSKKMQRSFVKRVCSTSAFLCALDATPGFFLPTDSYSACAAPKPWIYQKNGVRIRQTKQKKKAKLSKKKVPLWQQLLSGEVSRYMIVFPVVPVFDLNCVRGQEHCSLGWAVYVIVQDTFFHLKEKK